MKRVALLAFAVLAFCGLSFGKTITGTVSDAHCGAKHATASADAEHCVEHCASGGSAYVLVSNGKVYQLDSQDKFKGLGGKTVSVSGKVSGDSIKVANVSEKSS